ncbi:MAG: hypothetical protein IMY67_08535 [Bacteroidetes bacterium]|nr:hypothetical protein [Bacteroidota bacterium]
MKIRFQTKTQSNKIQQEAFLKLSKVERIYRFLWLMERISKYPTKEIKEETDNFIIVIPE